MSSMIQFDSSLSHPAPSSFGLGILPASQYDEVGNRLPIGQSDEDYAWYQVEMAAREAASWSDWTDAMDEASRVTLTEEAIREEAARQCEVDDMIADLRRRVEIDAEYALGRV